ncbi:unnamed protein product [Cuscuta campestris]|uniref:Strictosidine synthase conserved region domain-containing protein n=1 Tax=Cuscuta campestris TaxID=132261 RepID=A0A484NP89_9ASTE|nr:unnamed protein product [Cuscuta campestris]
MTTARLLAAILLLVAVYCAMDPFGHRTISDFVVHLVDQAPWSEHPPEKDARDLLRKSEIKFLHQIQGPESIAFDPRGRGPYTGVADGRVLFWNGTQWIEFAVTSPNRSSICDPKPNPTYLTYIRNEHICGRPLGLRFHKRTGELYIADAYYGLMKAGPEGGQAMSLTTEAEGVPFGFTNDLDVDDDGNVYFTDSSINYPRRNFSQLTFTGDNTGRVLKYNPKTKETTVLVRNVQFPNGLSLSKDGSFFVYCEGLMERLMKYWLEGEKEGTSEVMALLPGFPDNVRANEKGEFWVAIHSRRSIFSHMSALHPNLRKALVKLPIPTWIYQLMYVGGMPHGIIVKYSPEGKILQVLEDRKGKVVKAVSEVEEKDGKLWLGSVLMPFIAVYHLD